MKKLLKKNFKYKKQKVLYTEKKPFLADKEIIFRSNGRAKVFNISHRLQVFMLILFAAVFSWSGYNYYCYHISASIIHHKEKELGKTRDAYIDLMSDVTALQNNLKNVVAAVDEAGDGLQEIKEYKEKALVVEDKIKQIADAESWIDADKIEEKITKKEALLQKDIVQNENAQLKQKIEELGGRITNLQETVKGLETAEIAILDKIHKLSGREIEQIKTSLSQINKSLKAKKRYFNPLANIKEGKGGAFEPAPGMKIENSELLKKMSETFQQIDTLENYKQAMKGVPLGKPLYRYQLSSYFGTRQDPFKTYLANHKGLDMRAAAGSRISAPAAGKVITAGYQKNGYGNLVVVDHGNGFVTKYAHMRKIYVKAGERVVYNQALGEVGRTGRATGNHLHYEVLFRGVNVNPSVFIALNSLN
ncbi:MAG: peptidoglycan DD-metalloendopeptidase family protein [Pseudomonadota bacterium]|nr:peptidoglycan DD-metalloendopeptidase family protein [Pseudomonadota bacterium]